MGQPVKEARDQLAKLQDDIRESGLPSSVEGLRDAMNSERQQTIDFLRQATELSRQVATEIEQLRDELRSTQISRR